MNRRSFLKRLGLLAAVPFVPISAIKHLLPKPDIGYKCWNSNAENLEQLVSQIKVGQKHKLFQPRGPYAVISVKPRNYDHIESEIKPQGRFTDVALLDKGFDNFIMRGIPILSRG